MCPLTSLVDKSDLTSSALLAYLSIVPGYLSFFFEAAMNLI